MAYSTGPATSFADVLTAIVSLCTANGWTWDGTNNILSKGNVFVKFTVNATPTVAMSILGGTGEASGVLTTPSGTSAQMLQACVNPIVWPVTYHVLLGTAPDSVVVMINHGVAFWQWMIFGQAVNLGVPGLATYFGASVRSYIGSAPTVNVNNDANSGSGIFQNHYAIPFWGPDIAVGSEYQNCFLHVNLEGCVWANDTVLNGNPVRTDWPAAPLMNTQPNAWNADSMLIPLRIAGARPSNLSSYLAELPNVRLVRNTNYGDGDIITLGSDRWKLFPGRSKNTVQPNGATNQDHSGTYALAVHYDGP